MSEQTLLAARVISYHQVRDWLYECRCRCGTKWTPLHAAKELDKNGLVHQGGTVKTDKKTQMAAQVITAHVKVRDAHGICRCGKEWNPLHVAVELDKADLLCALKTADLP